MLFQPASQAVLEALESEVLPMHLVKEEDPGDITILKRTEQILLKKQLGVRLSQL